MKNRKLLLSLLLFALLGFVSANSLLAKALTDGEQGNTTDWKMIGPDNVAGRVRAAMFDRNNYGVVYAGTVAGLYVSVDNGRSWREISLGSGHENITALAQDENGVIYVGTGEGYYTTGLHNMSHLGYSDEATGRVGTGIYKSNVLSTNWTEGLNNIEPKYEWICSNLSFSRVEGTEVSSALSEYEDWSYINAMTYANNTVYVATKNSGLHAINTVTNSIEDIVLGIGYMNVYDVVTNANGVVAVAYSDDVNGAEIAIVSTNEDGTHTANTILTSATINAQLPMGRVKLLFGNNNPNTLYAYIAAQGHSYGGYYVNGNSYESANGASTSALSGMAMGVWKTTSIDDPDWKCITSSSFSNGQQHNYAMSLAVDDNNNREILYVGANSVLRGQDVNGNGIFSFSPMTSPTMDMTDLETSVTYGMGYVPANIHSILFMRNPQSTMDSIFQLYTTDAGVYTYQYDSILQAAIFTPGKGMNNSQVYKVAAASDGSVMAATQSNAISYIPSPSEDGMKSAKRVWAVNSTNYPSNYFYEEGSNYYAANSSISAIASSGTNVISSAINKILPASNARKPYIVARPFLNVARTYGNKGVYDEIETETVWNFGGATNVNDMGYFMSEKMYKGNMYANFVTPMAYWEKFDGATNIKDSIPLTLKVGTEIIRGDEHISIIRGQEILRGDKVVISDNNFLGYPFIHEFDLSYKLDAVQAGGDTLFYYDTAVTDTTAYKFKILPKVQTRLAVVTPQGVFLTAQPMDFSRKYDYVGYLNITDTTKFLLWRRLFSVGDIPSNGDFSPKHLNETVRNVAFSADGGSIFLTLDVYNDGSGTNSASSYEVYSGTKLIRIDGINDTTLYYIRDRFAGNIQDTDRFTRTVIGEFDRRISSIATDPNNVNRLVLTFDGYVNNINVMYTENAMSDAPSFGVLSNPPQENSLKAPVYAALIEKFEGNTLFVGTEGGIYKMDNFTSGNGQWVKDGEETVPVYHLWQQTQNRPQVTFTDQSTGVSENVTYGATSNAGVIYAATYGRGILMNKKYQQENPDAISYVSLPTVRDTKDALTLSIYPNPTKTYSTISYSLNEPSNVVFRMYDMNGRLVSTLDNGREAKGQHSQIVDVNSMKKGVYVVQLITESSTRTAKLIVE